MNRSPRGASRSADGSRRGEVDPHTRLLLVTARRALLMLVAALNAYLGDTPADEAGSTQREG